MEWEKDFKVEDLLLLDKGYAKYAEIWVLQKNLVKKRIQGEIIDTLILVEHPPVITLGKKAKKEELLVSEDFLFQHKIEYFYVERGGRVTFHGPGQLVAYPIVDLSLDGKDIHRYLRNLEEVIIRVLKKLGIEGERIKGYTGVWVKGEKVASIGIGVRRWVTYHGLALNVNTDLSYFSLINPCGIESSKITSLSRILPGPLDMKEIKNLFLKCFREVFKRKIIRNEDYRRGT